jgi:hypothetical protein
MIKRFSLLVVAFQICLRSECGEVSSGSNVATNTNLPFVISSNQGRTVAAASNSPNTSLPDFASIKSGSTSNGNNLSPAPFPISTNTIIALDGTVYGQPQVMAVTSTGLIIKYIQNDGRALTTTIVLTNLPLDYQNKWGQDIRNQANEAEHESELKVKIAQINGLRAEIKQAEAMEQAEAVAEMEKKSLDDTERVRTNSKIYIITQILENYHKSHVYLTNNINADNRVYVCGDMACDIWDQLQVVGINAIIEIGDVNEDIQNYRLATHVWVLAEIEPNSWLALETTGGCVVYRDQNERYYRGWGFKTPKQFRDYDSLVRLNHHFR